MSHTADSNGIMPPHAHLLGTCAPERPRKPFLPALVLPALLLVAAALAAQPIANHPKNGRYYIWRGKPTVLIASGEHYGALINLDFDYHRYLDHLEKMKLNHTRVFMGSYIEHPGNFAIVDNTLAPAPNRVICPWARNNVRGYSRGGNKFDLDKWDESYFKRMHDLFSTAEKKGISIEVVFFFDGPESGPNASWVNAPFNPKNNINNTTGIKVRDYLTLENGNILGYQEKYVRKLVRELNKYDNVIFNISEDPWANNQDRSGTITQPSDRVKAFLKRVSEWIVDEEPKLPWKHFISVDLSFGATVVTPAELEKYWPLVYGFNTTYDDGCDFPVLNRGVNKVFAYNENGFRGTEAEVYRVIGWNYMMAGGAMYNNLDYSFTVDHEDGTGQNPQSPGSNDPKMQLHMSILLACMNSIPFVEMQPSDDVVTGGGYAARALASPGKADAVFFSGNGLISPSVNLPVGNYVLEWVDILTGTVQDAEVFSHSGGNKKIKPTTLSGGGGALRIFANRTTITSVALPDGVAGTHYQYRIEAARGQGGVMWDVTDQAALPPGITLGWNSGSLGGMPSKVGTYTFTLVAKDSAGNADSREFTVHIAPAPAGER